MYSSRFEQALNVAGLRHADQVRKGTKAPYLVHLVHVAAVLARAGYDEDTQIVGLLHDLIEDTTSNSAEADALVTQLRRLYGDPITDAVLALTEPKRDPSGQKLPWRTRKDQYLSQLKSASTMALRVSAADKLHNLSTLAEELERDGEGVWKRFNKGPKETFWFYRAVYQTIRARMDEPVVAALGAQLDAMGIHE